MNPTPIRVTIIGGYLGAGKTTLLNHLLQSADERVAVLVNDFGDVNIDALLVESQEGDTISLANGCICCSMVDGFGAALDTVRAAEPRPDRLVIEASGVADPGQIAAYGQGPGLELDGVVTVVDAETIRRQARDEYIADVIGQQLAAADLIILNKMDLVDTAARESLISWVGEQTSALVVPAGHGVVPLEVLLGIEPRDHTLFTTRVASARFTSWTETFTDPLDRSELEQRLSSLAPNIARVKGVVRFTDDPDTASVVQVVGPRTSITATGPWDGGPSQLVFIEVKDRAQAEAEHHDHGSH
jgi:G3E family GTPase